MEKSSKKAKDGMGPIKVSRNIERRIKVAIEIRDTDYLLETLRICPPDIEKKLLRKYSINLEKILTVRMVKEKIHSKDQYEMSLNAIKQWENELGELEFELLLRKIVRQQLALTVRRNLRFSIRQAVWDRHVYRRFFKAWNQSLITGNWEALLAGLKEREERQIWDYSFKTASDVNIVRCWIFLRMENNKSGDQEALENAINNLGLITRAKWATKFGRDRYLSRKKNRLRGSDLTKRNNYKDKKFYMDFAE